MGPEEVAFSLISLSIFRGTLRSKEEVLRIGIEAVCEFKGYNELQEVHLCAHNTADAARSETLPPTSASRNR